MKNNTLSTILTFITLTMGLGLVQNQPTYAQSTTFVCGVSEGKPATIAVTPRGNIPIILWVSNKFTGAGFNPQRRCAEVSPRFQKLYDQGALTFITAGYLNNQPVICATGSTGGLCNSSNLLYTLKRGQDAAKTIQRLNEIRGGAAGVLREDTTGTNINNSESVNVNELLNNGRVDPNTSVGQNNSNPTPVEETPNTPNTGNKPNSGGGLW
ncbi:COP23 domain-containing protein [Anabaena catenula]|uniref:Circadian oscillating protein COP23 n=1 Tax=Anabaena catenula FACHB-362 TaxID=2692877 RepID=A0ABR8J1E2_9NOST|nr:COP23 domain-containing protein [Anabaena catenula]MBD2691370.1 hypothetical protein [Anabaena catenula FACHB-362]